VYYDAPTVFSEHLLVFPGLEGTRPRGAGRTFAPVLAAKHAFEQCPGIKFDILCPEYDSMIGAQFQCFLYIFFSGLSVKTFIFTYIVSVRFILYPSAIFLRQCHATPFANKKLYNINR
jgi:hypothetical protein